MKRKRPGYREAALASAIALFMAGCSTLGGGNPPTVSGPTSVQTLEYYPYQVKGYQGTYPHRSIIVLLPEDARVLAGSNMAPIDGNPAIGVVTDQSEKVLQRLVSAPLPSIVQSAVGRSAEEAGLQASPLKESAYTPAQQKADYVIASRITRCWVKKHRGADGHFGPAWSTAADFALEITIYKPPFKVAFWQGTSSSTYFDPPVGSFGLGPEDEAGIYDEPGQVLSVALTRAAAGIFQRDDLHNVILDDHINHR